MGQRPCLKFRPDLRLPSLPADVWPAQAIPAETLSTIPNRAAFETLATRADVPGTLGVREVKFLISDADTDQPKIHFLDPLLNPLHYHFARDTLGWELGAADFNRVTYFTENRQFIAGSVLAYDNYLRPDGSPGLYVLEFWPTDPIGAPHVATAYRLLQTAIPFAAESLAYHPSGDIQEQRFIREADLFAAKSIQTISTSELFEGVVYSPLNLGEAVGILRLLNGDDPRPPSATDIVIYETLPNDLPIVAGVISAAPQTPLSHVNLRAQQNDIPNAYLRNALNDDTLLKYIGQPIRLKVNPDQLEITPVTLAEMATALEARRPQTLQTPARDLGPTAITALDDLAWSDVGAFGAKSTNLAELRRTIDPKFVPNGFAIPFSFYHDFMTANGLYDTLRATIADPAFADDTQRADLLKSFRKAIKSAPLTTPMRDQLDAMHRAFPEGTTPRCRSSANNEDLIGFTGAGLYDSYTHRQDEGHIEKSIKQVWASLWTLRAYNERDFYRIDQMTAAMGVLVHPNFDDERVNGVALTRNFYFPQFEGYFINAQIGEDLITNPDGTDSAEEVLVMQNLDTQSQRPYETVYIRRSSRVAPNDTVIGFDDLMTLTAQLKKIQSHFARLYRRASDENFAMDVEFKIDRNGLLALKQARPWVQ